MDLLDHLCVRFHFGGEFFNDGKFVHYLGGSEALSWIDRDKVYLPDIRGHLQDHCEITEDSLLHWLFPGKELSNGLKVLTDDKTCIVIALLMVALLTYMSTQLNKKLMEMTTMRKEVTL